MLSLLPWPLPFIIFKSILYAVNIFIDPCSNVLGPEGTVWESMAGRKDKQSR